MPIAAGSILKGNIEIERELGRGAMGVVWRARNLALDCPVAVKVLAAHVTDDPDARARFAREARAIAKVDSPHVVRIFDYGVTDDNEPFFVMELLRGEDLRTRIHSQGPLGVDTTVAIVRQLCLALERAHELGIVHRDLKPANVLVLKQPGPVFVSVLDFGVAKLAGPQELDLTASGGLVGTPYYMSPEQLLEPRSVDSRADLWSVAVLAYVCFVGKVPFDGETVGALSVAVHRGVFVPPSVARPGLPATLDPWFQRAFDLDPAQRFGSAALLARTLEEAALGTPLSTRDSPPPPESRSEPAQGRSAGSAARESKRAVAAVDESMAGVGASVPARRPARPTLALLVLAVLLAGALVFLVVSPRVNVATTRTTSAVLPVDAPSRVSGSATGSDAPVLPTTSVERPPTATDAPLPPPPPPPPPSPASAAQAAAEPRTIKSAPRPTATPTSRESADPQRSPPPPPPVDIDGVPIVE